jgi:hypothetical protein
VSSRRQTVRVDCAAEGCRECAWYEYDTKTEAREAFQRRQEYPYRCYRHSRPDEVLSADNPQTEVILVASKIQSYGYERNLAQYEARKARGDRYLGSPPQEFIDGLFWLRNGTGSGSGLTHGDGYRAIARDFPEGTRLVVSARIEYPSTPPKETPHA